MQGQRINVQSFLEVICFAGFGGILLYLIISGKYLLYIAPRLKPYLYFTAIMMGVWALAGIGKLFYFQYKIHVNHCFLLVIPVFLLILPHTPLRAADFSGNYAGGNGTSKEFLSDSSGTSKENVSLRESGNEPETTGSKGLPGLDLSQQTISVSDKYFGMWFSEIYMNMEQYEGYTVTMTGFVLKDSELMKADEFVPARLAMTCCAADLEPVGVTCRYDKASELKDGSWVTVKGTLIQNYKEYDGKQYADPVIEVTGVEPAEEVEGYVYPY